jgi:hypothetical protein
MRRASKQSRGVNALQVGKLDQARKYIIQEKYKKYIVGVLKVNMVG